MAGSVPTCPACGAKFSHDREMAMCKSCGCPDEVIAGGAKAIARWKRRPWSVTPSESGIVNYTGSVLSKNQVKRARVAGQQRRRNKHGRRGVR